MACPRMTQPAPLLAVKGVTKTFGGVNALKVVSFELRAG